MSTFYSIGFGVGTQNSAGEWLEVYYHEPVLSPSSTLCSVVLSVLKLRAGNHSVSISNEQLSEIGLALADAGESNNASQIKALENSTKPLVMTLLQEDVAPTTVPEVYLKLQLLSHRLVKPHETVLDGMFAVLPNVAWTSDGAIDINELAPRQLQARLAGRQLSVDCVDKFPKMTDYVVPAGVRIADTSRVRLGAYIGEGTTIMHEGFVNFNAGTLGTSMVEGRISAGVIVGKGSDLGGGCSTMGTLSGGGNIVISVGEESLIGANAGIGIPLGDRCIVESGLYITAGSKVAVLDDKRQVVEYVKARDLAGKPDLLFRRNSQSGALECLTNKSAIALNEELHANN